MKSENKVCSACKHFRKFERPFQREDGAVIYGYCFKDAKSNYSPNMGKGYPVVLPPDAAGACIDTAYQNDKGLHLAQLLIRCMVNDGKPSFGNHDAAK